MGQAPRVLFQTKRLAQPSTEASPLDVFFRAFPGLLPQKAQLDPHYLLFDGKESVVCRTPLPVRAKSRQWTTHAPMEPPRQLRSRVPMNPVLMSRIRNDQDCQDGRQQEDPSPVEAFAARKLHESSIDDTATASAHGAYRSKRGFDQMPYSSMRGLSPSPAFDFSAPTTTKRRVANQYAQSSRLPP